MKPEEDLITYIDTCEMCTDLNCDDCYVEVAIDELEKQLQIVHCKDCDNCCAKQ